MKKLVWAAGVSLSLALSAGTALAATPSKVLVVAKNLDDIVTLDPASAYEFSSGEIVSNTYDRLVQFTPDDTTKLMPGLAQSWTVSEDGKTITFTLRDGVKFQSGNPVRPEDVIFSFRRVLTINKAPAFILAQLGWTKENLDTLVKKTGENQVSLTHTGSFGPAFFLNVLAARPASVVDEVEVMKNQKDGDLGHAWLNTTSAGSGAFKLTKYAGAEGATLTANKNYFGGAPEMNSIVFRNIKEAGTQRVMLEKGDIDIARNLTPDQIVALQGKPDVQVGRYPQAAVHFVSLNQKTPGLQNPALWEAMRYLIDYDGIANKMLNGQMSVHQAFWPKGFPGSYDEAPFRYDAAKAKEILEKAGLKDLTFDMDVISSSPFTDIAQAIQATMASAGIKVNILPGTGAQVITKYRARTHQMMLLYWGPDFIDPHSNAKAFAYNVDNSDDKYQSTTTWRNAWHVPELSEKTMAALKEADPAKRLTMYTDLQKEVQAKSPIIVMFQAQDLVASQSNVKGYVHGATSDLVFYRKITK
jgi:peptide/nickel transport system substrate-binding protein